MTNLTKWISERKLTLQQFADLLAVERVTVTGQAVGMWCSGERLPRPVNAAAIVAVTGGEVSLNDIYQPERTAA